MAFLRFLSLSLAALSLQPLGQVSAQDSGIFSFSADGPGLQLGASGVAPEIRVDPNDLPGVLRVADDLATDFGRVLGTNGTVVKADWSSTSSTKSNNPIIVIGTIGHSSLIDGLVSARKIDTSSVANKWETFSYQVVTAPWPSQDAAFVIAGSDMQGTIFGAYDVSEQIGVSPWHWWGDVPPTKREHVWVQSKSYVAGPPSVKFRGIFLNDESPGLTGWGHGKYKDSQYGSPFITDFYKNVFELILRLKGNYLWPAMWSSMFYLDDPKNGPTATEYGVYMGTSHHEPMARADKEQNRFLKGSWDWGSNKAGVQSFMQEGVTRSKNWSTIYTLGMRGSGDAASATLTSKALEDVIHWQQSVLKSVIGKPLSEIPQAWVMYKEVPGYWQKGMDVSDDVTLLWSDDNRGNIRRVPIANETARAGGSGIYYHFDCKYSPYVGDPRNYKWINTIQLQKTWEQMTLAHDRGIRNIWIANVGDLKGLELPIAHFMALAWDRTSFNDPARTTQWLTKWSGRQFGDAAAANVSSIMNTYGRLISRMKYEDLSRTPFAFNTVNYDEAENNFHEWENLAAKAQATYDSIPSAAQNAFFAIVLHPVVAGKGVYEIYTKAALGPKYANQHRASTNDLAKDVQTAFAQDKDLTKRFHTILNGKWNHIMDQIHIGYNNWQDPGSASLPKLTYASSSGSTSSSGKGALMGLAVQGSNNAFPSAASLALPTLTPYTSAPRWLDVFARDNGTFSYQITSSVPYVTVTNDKSTVSSPGTPDVRTVVSVDWDAAPAGSSIASLSIKSSDGTTATVTVPLDKTPVPVGFKGHVESSGVVSIEAEQFDTLTSGKEYVVIPYYGRTLSGVRLPPTTASQGPAKGPALVYPFYTFSSATAASVTVYLSPSENSNPTSPNRYSFSVDGGTVTTVQPVPLGDAGNEPAGWSDAVIVNAYVKNSKIGSLAAGKHELRFYLLEPTMVVTKIVIDVGGLQSSLMGPPESKRVS
ncbi:hypothetical protein GQ53DRAFT_827247 [Thozetella sp. PMI_491]|nr:hypothetical protein GQ53DRAFT_827247 [Thozetella sp. PMI_491]